MVSQIFRSIQVLNDKQINQDVSCYMLEMQQQLFRLHVEKGPITTKPFHVHIFCIAVHRLGI